MQLLNIEISFKISKLIIGSTDFVQITETFFTFKRQGGKYPMTSKQICLLSESFSSARPSGTQFSECGRGNPEGSLLDLQLCPCSFRSDAIRCFSRLTLVPYDASRVFNG